MVLMGKGPLGYRASKEAGKAWLYYLNSAITLAIMLGFQFIPAIDPITPLGMQILGLFLGLVYGWTTVGLVWPSLLGLVLLGLTDYMSVNEAFQSGWGHSTTVFILLIVVFAYVVDKAGVTEIIATFIIARDFTKGRPWVLSGLLLLATYVVAAFVSITPSVLLMWSMLHRFCEVFGYKKKEPYPMMMMVGITLAGLMGQSAFPFKPHAVMLMGVLQTQTGMTIDPFPFTALSMLIGLTAVGGYLLLCRFVFRPDVSKIRDSDYVLPSDRTVTTYQKQVFAALGAFIFFLFLPFLLPAGSEIKAFFTQLGNVGTVSLVLIAMALFRRKDGSVILDIADAMHNGVRWPVMCLVSTALAMSSAVVSEQTGIQQALVMALDPIFGSTSSGIPFVAVGVFLILFLTNCSNNLTTGLIMLPVMIAYAPMFGLDIRLITVVVCIMVNYAIILPSAISAAAMMHASEWCESRKLFKYTVPAVIMGGIIGIAYTFTIGQLFFM